MLDGGSLVKQLLYSFIDKSLVELIDRLVSNNSVVSILNNNRIRADKSLRNAVTSIR